MNKLSETMRGYITEALLLLLHNKPFAAITIGEITKKAGVNRSTYYRNFASKEEIIKYFYTQLLRSCLSSNKDMDMKQHLLQVFEHFKNHKEDLLCLHQHHLSYLLLECLSTFFMNTAQNRDSFAIYYHTGGIFHTFLWWFDSEMKLPPSYLVNKAIAILPPDFKAML